MTNQAGSICAIADIPGLYISDLRIPSSIELLKTHGITHVLSLTNHKYRPNIDKTLGIKHLHFAVDDNPFEDLLMALEGLCAWINYALGDGNDVKVLVHCIEGISRSGAIVVAMLMHNCSLEYETALQLAQTSRRVILPNSGFAEQLRLWAALRYSVLESESNGAWKEKQEYEDWSMNRGILLSKEEAMIQALRRKDMADMVMKLSPQKIAPQSPFLGGERDSISSK